MFHTNYSNLIVLGLTSYGPRIINITASSSTSLQILWEKALLKAGNITITNYIVCYDVLRNENGTTNCSQNIAIPRDIINNTSRNIELTELNEATTYNIAIKAVTNKGYGYVSKIHNGTTLEDSK